MAPGGPWLVSLNASLHMEQEYIRLTGVNLNGVCDI